VELRKDWEGKGISLDFMEHFLDGAGRGKDLVCKVRWPCRGLMPKPVSLTEKQELV